MAFLSNLVQIDLVHNLAVLISTAALSGIAGRRWQGLNRRKLVQGVLFGLAAILTMLAPMPFVPGVQFDSRSVALSICGAHFGPLAACISGVIAAGFRVHIGGAGTLTGVLVVIASSGLGVLFYYRGRTTLGRFTPVRLWLLGLVVHIAMLALMFTLPGGLARDVLPKIAPSVLTFFPLATVFLGMILADQRIRRDNVKRLREHQEQLQLFLKHSPAAIAMFDTSMCYIAASERWRLDYGLGNQALIGRSHYEVFPEISDDWKAIHRRCLAGDSESREEDEFVRADGSIDWVRWAIRPWYQNSGEVGGIVIFTEVITERKAAEMLRLADERRFRSVFNQQFQYMAILSPEGQIMEVNELLLNSIGASKADVQGQVFWESPGWRDLPEAQESWPAQLERARQTGVPQTGVVEYRDAAGSIRHADSAVTAIYADNGELDYFIVQGTDVTDEHHARQALHATNRLLERIFEAMSDVVLVVDTNDRTIIRCNPAVQPILGYAPEELIGKNTRFLYETEAAYVEVGRASRKSLEDGHTFRGETKLCRKDGSLIQTETAVGVISSDTDWRTGVVAVIRDVTARKESELALSQMAERLSATLESITDAFFTLDRNWRFTYLNSEAERLLRHTKSDLLNKIAGDEFQEVREGEIIEHFKRAMNNQVTEHFETYYAPFDQWFEIHAYPSAEGLSVYFRDISERVQQEEKLRRVTKRLQEILNFSPFLITEIDIEGRYLIANPAAASLLSIDSETLVGQRFHDILPEALAARFSERLAEVVRRRAPLVAEDTFQVPDARTFNTTLFPVIDESGEVVSVGAIGLDVTAQRAADAERKRLESQLRQAQRMEAVGRLAGGIAHDFNNMLGVILGHTELSLMALPENSPVRADLMEVQSAANRSADLTRQLLAFARRQTIAPRPLDLNEIIGKMLSMLGRLLGEDVKLEWEPGADLPLILADPSQIDQILANLAVNARDAIEGNGTMGIKTAVSNFDSDFCAQNPDYLPGTYVSLSVSDDGCGMDESVRAQIFDPFFTTKPQGRGTGLGLATVYGIAQQNGGFIVVSSQLKKGSCFQIFFPALSEEATASKPESKRNRTPGGDETILLVEDESALLSLSQRMLERLGYRVLATSDPREAITLATAFEGTIQLLVTDVIMPEMNGKELREVLHALRPDLRTLFISGYTADVIARHGALDQNVHFLQKPFRIDQFAARVRDVLDQNPDAAGD